MVPGLLRAGSGSDLASLRTRAVLDEAAGEFVINGEKIWTSEGMEADYCMLLVRTDPDAPPHKGISALLVPLDTPGITRRPITQITARADSLRCSSTTSGYRAARCSARSTRAGRSP